MTPNRKTDSAMLLSERSSDASGAYVVPWM